MAVGEGEQKWKIGDKVGGPWHGGHDGICNSCRRGLNQICENGAVNGVNRDGGCTFKFPFSFPSYSPFEEIQMRMGIYKKGC